MQTSKEVQNASNRNNRSSSHCGPCVRNSYGDYRECGTPMSATYRDLLEAIKEHSGMEEDEIAEAGTHGADAGWPGFIYTTDGADFYRANSELIDGLLQESADSMGYGTVAELVATFNRRDMADTRDGHDCLLAWFALEEAGHYLQQDEDDDDIDSVCETSTERFPDDGYSGLIEVTT